MPNNESAAIALANLAVDYSPIFIDEAIRQVLQEGTVDNGESSLGRALVEEYFDFNAVAEAIEKRLQENSKIGKPLPPVQAQAGVQPQSFGRIGFLGNPMNLDQDFQGRWQVTQSNGWTAWFNIVARAAGGFKIQTPASQLSRSGQYAAPPMRGQDAIAEVIGSNTITFIVGWDNHSKGKYECTLDSDKKMHGKTQDVNLANGSQVDFHGEKLEDGTTAPIPTPKLMPLIDVSVVQNNSENGLNVTVRGSGFTSGEPVTIQGRATRGTQVFDWSFYTSGVADGWGHLSCPPFGIFKPVDTQYAFRGFGEESGYTSEVGA